MYRVLLPVDSSEERVRDAVSVVSNFPDASKNISVTILNVFKEFDVVDDSGGRVKSADLLEDYDPPSTVDLAGALLDENGIEWAFRTEHGDPTEVILTVAEDESINSIVMASGGRSPAGKALFGSVTQDVLLNADRPVVVV